MQPRIYTYKITFEEVPYWYWGVHKEKKFGEKYWGSPTTHRWMWEFYTPKIQILEFFPFTEEGWKKANEVEDRLILPDLNDPLCLNESCGGVMSLAIRSSNGKKAVIKNHAKKDEEGKSILAIKMGRSAHLKKNPQGKSVHGLNSAYRLNFEKDELGRSVNAVKGAEESHKKTHADKTEEGKSKHAIEMAKISHLVNHSKKDERGKSVQAVNAARLSNAQMWESTVDGFRGRACSVAIHNKSNGWDPKARVKIT